MALRKTVALVDQFDERVTFTDAYHRVDRIEGGKAELCIYLTLYKSRNSSRPLTHKIYRFIPSLDGVNFIAQAYEYLKTLPEFADAVDC